MNLYSHNHIVYDDVVFLDDGERYFQAARIGSTLIIASSEDIHKDKIAEAFTALKY